MSTRTKYVVLGCGLVGSVIARDLASDKNSEVLVADISEENLKTVARIPRLKTVRADLSQESVVRDTIRDATVVIGAVPGRMGFGVLKIAIEAGKPISDIAFSPENPLQLDELAKSKGVCAVVDCGVSPGLSNLAIGRAASRLETIDEAVIYVGGLPLHRYWPYEYRVVFSGTDVIEEYTRPARMIQNGEIVSKTALTEAELIDFPGVGTLEAFNTDGLRTLLHTVEARNMREKTLRYPGHIDRMRMLRDTGFLSDKAVEIDGVQVTPRKLAEKLLFAAWKRPVDEPELTVLRVIVDGKRSSGTSAARFTFDLVDRTDEQGNTSMARTTGYPCAIMARMLADRTYSEPGVKPPELFAGNNVIYERLLSELRKRDIDLHEYEREL